VPGLVGLLLEGPKGARRLREVRPGGVYTRSVPTRLSGVLLTFAHAVQAVPDLAGGEAASKVCSRGPALAIGTWTMNAFASSMLHKRRLALP